LPTTNVAMEISDGIYKITLTAVEMNADIVALQVSDPQAVTESFTFFTSTVYVPASSNSSLNPVPANTPKFAVGETVYILESAALGFMEPYKIEMIVHSSPDRITYFLYSGPRPPTVTTSFGDRISQHGRPVLEYEEAELITHEVAMNLSISNAAATLSKLQAQQDLVYPGATDGMINN